MAYKVIVEIFDDLDGKKIESGGETIDFSLGAVEYSIDLRDEHAAELRKLLGGYARRARRIGGRKQWAALAPASDNGLPEVRRWARAHGYQIHGARIPQAILKQYAAAHPSRRS
ncbi:histone-like nucleoid-structuring protein Lsr2 [Prescottella agglutinans]|uniref:histone-like nucleoid-structuring protein Lsr2 n=1 Tax=Prescottella agglutinans TaxID=1644129 RepID=UPI003D95FC7D